VRSKRTLQIVLGLVGVAYLAMTYPLVTDLWHAKWLLVMKNETEPMFLSFFIALGVFLVLAARKPFAYRSLILFAAWQSIAHASVMAIQTAQAWQNNVHRSFTDVVVVAVIGSVLMAIAPARQEPAEIVRQTELEPAQVARRWG
jgi:predicted membrane-bound dolichyl-phosphate-mannose-protein mannosyltransferase